MGGTNVTEETVFGVIAKDGETGGTANATADFSAGSVTLQIAAETATGAAEITGEVTEFFYAAEDPYEVDITGTTVVGTSITVGEAKTLTQVPAKDPTCEEPGNKEYWNCPVCGKLFLDTDATWETTFEEVIIPETDLEPSDVDGTPGVSSGDRTALARSPGGGIHVQLNMI